MLCRSFLILVILLKMAQLTCAQEPDKPPVKKSENKVILEGKVYYIHIVQEGQTLYSIARAYGVTERDIVLENPDAFAGLRTGQVLKIPEESVVEEVEIKPSEKYLYHVIKQGETLYFLSRKYGIPVGTIEEHNPEVKYSDLQIDQVIRIPRIRQDTIKTPADSTPQPDSTQYEQHFVKPGQTLFSISGKYGVSIEDLIAVNPSLQEKELQSGQWINIPVPLIYESPADSMLAGILPGDSIQIHELPEYDPLSFEIMERKVDCQPLEGKRRYLNREYNIALLLPLMIESNEMRDTLFTREQDKSNRENVQAYSLLDPRSVNAIEFYEGFLLAIDSIKKKGLNINLHVFDTERSPQNVRAILSKPDMTDMDLIVGPFYSFNVEIVTGFALFHHIPMVSPVSTDRQFINGNPYVFQFCPSEIIETKAAAEFLKNQADKNILIIYSGDSAELDIIRRYKAEILKSMIFQRPLEQIAFSTVIANDTSEVDLSEYLTKDKANLVLIPSSSEPYVSTIMARLNFQELDYDITVFGLPAWVNFINIDLDYFHRLKAHYLTPFYFKPGDKELWPFMDKTRTLLDHIAYRTTTKGYNFLYLGFDVGYLFLDAFIRYGEHMHHCFERQGMKLLLSDYHFERGNPFSGYENKSIQFVAYDTDFMIRVIPARDYRY